MPGQFSYAVEGPIPEPLLKAAQKGVEHVKKAFVEEYAFTPRPLMKPTREESIRHWKYFSKITPIMAYEFSLNIKKNALHFRLVLLERELIDIMKHAEGIFLGELRAVTAAALESAGIEVGKRSGIYV